MGRENQHMLRAWVGVLLCLWMCVAQADWLPVSPEELALRSEPLAPQAPAIYLYRQVDRDDDTSLVRVYNRIKILTEEGRDQANIKINYRKDRQRVRGIEARTIRPDGSIVEFTGSPYDQTLVKGQDHTYSAKVLTLTDVQVGSIIEYRYVLSLGEGYVYDSNWVLNETLFTKRAKFSLVPNQYYALSWSWPLGLPPGTKPPEKIHGKIQMETNNVTAFVEEEYMPPESAVKMRVDFIYYEVGTADKDPVKFWQRYGKRLYGKFDDFIDQPAIMRKTVATIVSSDDSAATKARKLYVWVQKLRNLSFERRRSEAEAKREDLNVIRDAEDVLKYGYGSGDQINWLYAALVRAAGLQAHAVHIAPRNDYFFTPAMMNPHQLSTYVIQLNIDGIDIFVDPGTAFTPFEVLPWTETAVKGLRLDERGGTWVNTPAPQAAQSRIERRATLQLNSAGTLEGKLQVTFHGLTALSLRLNARLDDATERKNTLEQLIKSYVPTGIDVTLSNTPDWDSATLTMAAEFDLKIAGWVQPAGNRALFPAALFGAEVRHDFDHASRVHPIYFRYPYSYDDEVTVRLPSGWRVGTLPPAQNEAFRGLEYKMKVVEQEGGLQLQRHLLQGHFLLTVPYYDILRDFFQQVRAGDEQQVILLRATNAAKAH